MRNLLLTVLFMVLNVCVGQTVNIGEATDRINGKTIDGYATTLNNSREATEDIVKEWAKTIGDIKGYQSYTELIPTNKPEVIIYITVKGSAASTVWIGSETEDTKALAESMTNYYYQIEWQRRIEEVEDVIELYSKDLQRTERDFNKTVRDSTRYYNNILKYEERLIENKDRLEGARNDINSLIFKQDSLQNEIEEIQLLLDRYKREIVKWQ